MNLSKLCFILGITFLATNLVAGFNAPRITSDTNQIPMNDLHQIQNNNNSLKDVGGINNDVFFDYKSSNLFQNASSGHDDIKNEFEMRQTPNMQTRTKRDTSIQNGMDLKPFNKFEALCKRMAHETSKLDAHVKKPLNAKGIWTLAKNFESGVADFMRDVPRFSDCLIWNKWNEAGSAIYDLSKIVINIDTEKSKLIRLKNRPSTRSRLRKLEEFSSLAKSLLPKLILQIKECVDNTKDSPLIDLAHIKNECNPFRSCDNAKLTDIFFFDRKSCDKNHSNSPLCKAKKEFLKFYRKTANKSMKYMFFTLQGEHQDDLKVKNLKRNAILLEEYSKILLKELDNSTTSCAEWKECCSIFTLISDLSETASFIDQKLKNFKDDHEFAWKYWYPYDVQVVSDISKSLIPRLLVKYVECVETIPTSYDKFNQIN